ncbi:hypothetical protein OROGR_012617 [Orobanche gracilis]
MERHVPHQQLEFAAWNILEFDKKKKKMAGSVYVKRANEGYGVGLVRNTSFGRKRVTLSSVCLEFGDDGDDDCIPTMPLKRRCSKDSFLCAEKITAIEDLPLEILSRTLCGVDHDDLKSLFLVSKSFREATLMAKQSHFAFSTPRKTPVFKTVGDIGTSESGKAPYAPKQSRIQRPRLSAKKLADISVNLFGSSNHD